MNVAANASAVRPKVILTWHAVERFQKRLAPHLTGEEARARLAALVPTATLLEGRSLLGQEQWLVDQAGTPRFIFLTKNDPKIGVVCVTVLSEWMQAPTQEELDEAADATRRTDADRAKQKARASLSVPFPPSPREVSLSHFLRMKEQKAAKEKRKAEREATVKAKEQADKEARAERKATNIAAQAKVPGQVAHLKNEAAMKQRSHEAQIAKMQGHAERMNQDAIGAKRLLRFALRALRPLVDTNSGAAIAWQQIGEIDPRFLRSEFIDYEKPTT